MGTRIDLKHVKQDGGFVSKVEEKIILKNTLRLTY